VVSCTLSFTTLDQGQSSIRHVHRHSKRLPQSSSPGVEESHSQMFSKQQIHEPIALQMSPQAELQTKQQFRSSMRQSTLSCRVMRGAGRSTTSIARMSWKLADWSPVGEYPTWGGGSTSSAGRYPGCGGS